MNIMKTNMLLLDNKIIKEDAGNTATVDAPSPSPVEPKEGMKALSFLGMKNLMSNPQLAKELGVMNEQPAEKSAAESYVAPYSSNMAFKGTKNVAKAVAMSAAVLMGAAALQSCDKVELSTSNHQEVQIDMDALIAAITNGINELKQEIRDLKEQLAYKDAEQAERDKQVIIALNKALDLLIELNTKVEKQNLTLDEFKTMIYGQNEAILDAIVVLQNITKEEAKAQVDRILDAYAKGLIDIKTAMAEIQALLKTNNELLGEILAGIKTLNTDAQKANEKRDSLLAYVKEIIENQKGQREELKAGRDSLIKQNNIVIKDIEKILASKIDVNVDSIVSLLSNLNIPESKGMSEDELREYLEALLAQLKASNKNLQNVNVDTTDLVNAAKEIQAILNQISADVQAILGKLDSILDLLKEYGNAILEKEQSSIDILKQIKANSDTIKVTDNNIKDILENSKPMLDSLYKAAKERNVYLDIISKHQANIETMVKNINEKGLTKEQLEDLIKTKVKPYLDAIHAENLEKAGEVIGYQKEGNKIALDIYNLLLNKLDKLDKLNPEELKALIKAIYDYLPELKCNCNCQANCNQNQAVNEGIIDIINP